MTSSYRHASRRLICLLVLAAVAVTALSHAATPDVAGAKTPKKPRVVQAGPKHHSRSYVRITRRFWTPWRLGHATPWPTLKVRWTPHERES